jgi:hypothetical protein
MTISNMDFSLSFLNSISFFLIPLFSHLTTASGGTVSITQFPAFSTQRYCVQECIYSGRTNGAPPLPRSLSCKQPYSDSCMCRTDLASSASSLLADCINSACSDSPPDVTSASPSTPPTAPAASYSLLLFQRSVLRVKKPSHPSVVVRRAASTAGPATAAVLYRARCSAGARRPTTDACVGVIWRLQPTAS